MISAYYEIIKPGIVYGNTVTAMTGFIVGSATLEWASFGAATAGLACIVASAAVINNYCDRTIDARMARTRERALVQGKLSGRAVGLYATALLVLGCWLLSTTLLALAVALIGFVAYTAVYTPL